MAQEDVQVRVTKFISNPLLQRKQFAIEVIHPTCGTVPKMTVRDKLAKLYRVADSSCVIVGSMNTVFGGGKTTGVGLIYDNITAAKKFEPRFRLVRMKVQEPKPVGITRRAKKDLKIRRKKVRGTAKAKVSGGKK